MEHELWATPIDPAYDTMIAQLAEHLRTPHFPAHVTVLEGFGTDVALLRELADGPFEIVFERVRVHDGSIVLEADDSEAFAALSQSAYERFGGSAARIVFPLVHFAPDPDDARAMIERALSFPLPIRFTRLELWDVKSGFSREGMKSWRMVERVAL